MFCARSCVVFFFSFFLPLVFNVDVNCCVHWLRYPRHLGLLRFRILAFIRSHADQRAMAIQCMRCGECDQMALCHSIEFHRWAIRRGGKKCPQRAADTKYDDEVNRVTCQCLLHCFYGKQNCVFNFNIFSLHEKTIAEHRNEWRGDDILVASIYLKYFDLSGFFFRLNVQVNEGLMVWFADQNFKLIQISSQAFTNLFRIKNNKQ